MGIRLFMSKLTNDKGSLRNKKLNILNDKKNKIARELSDNMDSYVTNKSYSKIDHIVGIKTLDILVRDICNANPYKALDLYLKVTNPKYTKYSGFLKTLTKDTKTYKEFYEHKYYDNAVVMNKKHPIPYMEIAVRRDLVSQLRAMKKYVNDNMLNIVKNSKNTSRKELVEVCRSRMSAEMVEFSKKLNIELYDERRYSKEKYYRHSSHTMNITDSPFMSDLDKELYMVGQHKIKTAQKAQVALLYNAIQDGRTIDKLKDTLEYREYEICVEYIRGLDGDTYDILERLLNERLPKDILDMLNKTKIEVIEKLNNNLDTYRELNNTELTSYLIMNILDSLK